MFVTPDSNTSAIAANRTAPRKFLKVKSGILRVSAVDSGSKTAGVDGRLGFLLGMMLGVNVRGL